MSKRVFLSGLQCGVDDCCSSAYSKMLCAKHYTRQKRHGDAHFTKNHGFKKNKSPAYTCWSHMKSRCYNKNNKDYHHYGGRGITVCDRWRDNFLLFYKDMGDRPSAEHSIDRIDTNGNYEPGNCRWATSYVQVKNRRIQKSNTSGVEGVNPHQDGGYMARITIRGKRRYLGYYKTKNEAVEARLKAESESL